MKTILAPTDFSASSLNAVNYAADLAGNINAKLVLFHAIPFPIAVSEISVPEEFIDDMLETGQRDMDELIERVQSRTRGRISITPEIAIGKVEHEIEKISARERPLVIVMGIRSGKSFERVLLGSSTFHIINQVCFPTLIIPDGVRFREIKSIGMACDLKRTEKDLPYETIKEWLYLFKSNLEIINIAPEDVNLKADQMTNAISLQNHLNIFKPRFHFLTGENIAEELNDFVKMHALDLLIIFPRKHGISKLLYKKESKSIITHNQVPILSMCHR
jgi:nucleotide-binding universal stress UspA family protein